MSDAVNGSPRRRKKLRIPKFDPSIVHDYVPRGTFNRMVCRQIPCDEDVVERHESMMQRYNELLEEDPEMRERLAQQQRRARELEESDERLGKVVDNWIEETKKPEYAQRIYRQLHVLKKKTVHLGPTGTKVGATVEKTEATQETVPVDLSRTRRRMMTSLDFLKDQCRIMEERKRRREEEDEAVNGPKKIKAIQGDFRFSIRVPAVENPQASNRNVSLYSSSDEYEGEAPSQEDIMDSVFPDFLEDAQSAGGVEDELSQEAGNEFGFSVRARSTQGTIPGTPIGSSSVSDFEEDAPRQGVVDSIFGDLLHRNDDNPPAEQEHFDISTPPETADGNYDWGARGCWVVRK